MTKKSYQNLKYLENEKSFSLEINFLSFLKAFQLSKIFSDLRLRLETLKVLSTRKLFFVIP